MAVNIQNLAGKSKGRIHNVVFYTRNEQQIVRILAHRVKNPRTAIQQINRSNMIPCLNAYKSLKPILYKSLNNRPDNYNVFHQFSSINLNHSFVNGQFQPENLLISSDYFDNDVFDYNYFQSETNNFQFFWTPSTTGNKQDSDLLCIVYYNSVSKVFGYIFSNCTRNTGLFSCHIPVNVQGSTSYIYLFFVTSDYQNSGNHSLIQFINS